MFAYQTGCEVLRFEVLQSNRCTLCALLSALQVAKPNLQYKKDCILEILKGAVEVGSRAASARC